MDEEEILILLKGEDKTKDVEYLSQDNNRIINIKFLNCDKKLKNLRIFPQNYLTTPYKKMYNNKSIFCTNKI